MLLANLGLMLAMLFWGGLIPGLNFVLDRWDPYFLSAVRYWIALPLLGVAIRLNETGPVLPAGLDWRRVFLVGGLGFGGFGGLYTLGVAHSNPVTAAILTAVGPVVATLVAWIGYRSPPLPGTGLSLLLATGGGLLAMIDWHAAGNPLSLRGGEPLLLLSAVCWSWYSIEAQRALPGLSQVKITFITMIPAVTVLSLAYAAAALFGQAKMPSRPSPTDFAMFLYMGIGVAGLGVLLWNHGVKRLGIVIASIYLNLIPVVAVSIIAAFGTRPRIEQLAGGLLVLAGIIHGQLRAFARRPADGR
jgi:drug/metabolite transporter (DMT)-like permease